MHPFFRLLIILPRGVNIFYFLFFAYAPFSGCSKLVTADLSPTEISAALIFDNDVTATAAMMGVYSYMAADATYSNGDVTILAGLSADELINYSPLSDQAAFYANSLQASNQNISRMWGQFYFTIYQTNAIINGLNGNNKLTLSLRQQLMGEAKFIRSFCYFYLLQFWSDVPLITGTDYKKNNQKPRVSTDSLYAFIQNELQDASTLLSDSYVYSKGEKNRPNKFAALSLLARAALYEKNYPLALEAANAVIDRTELYSLATEPNDVFLKNSSEAIWQLSPVEPAQNTREGSLFIFAEMPSSISLSPSLISDFSIEDKRLQQWTGSVAVGNDIYYFPFKYKIISDDVISEYYSILRLAELYLIRAEVRAYLNQLTGNNSSLSDINTIRTRAGLYPLNDLARDEFLAVILSERKHELFAEWGHRWFDLKRCRQTDLVLGTIKAPHWASTDQFYPLPQTEIENNMQLTQNEGY